jgi:tetratricopeptide (TPR) repeat protein
VVSKRLAFALYLICWLSACSSAPSLPPVIANDGGEDASAYPQQEIPVAPSAAAIRALPDTGGATLALLKQSHRAELSGNPDEAVAYVERAIRLNPRQADLWLRLARLQLTRKDPAAAVQFANKAIALAGQRMDWVRDAWLLIADARSAQGDTAAAAQIRTRWQTYKG